MSVTKSHVRVAAVFNECTESTIPFENFLHTEFGIDEKLIVSFNQTEDEVIRAFSSFSQAGKTISVGLANSRGLLAKAKSLLTCLKRFRPDVVHTHHAFSSFVVSILSSQLRSKVVVTIHNDFERMRLRHRIFFLVACRGADFIVCNSQSTYRSLTRYRRLFFRKTPAEIIYNGVNTNHVSLRSTLGSQSVDTTPRLICVARFVEQKDHATLIQGFAQVCDYIPAARLTLIGEGPTRESVEELARTLAIRERVEFLGSVPREIVYKELGEADVFIVTSHWEGFCNAMVEAALAGLPVIATDIPTLREVLGDGAAAFVQPGGTTELAQAILSVCNNYPSYLSKANVYRSSYLEKYSLSTSSSAYAELYARLAGNRYVGHG